VNEQTDAGAAGASADRAPALEQRRRALGRLGAERFDVLVVGGGVTGCGIALDAATRGLSVALVEKRDFAAGTSSRSSKLIHGGLRYLQSLDLGLVREALHERRLLVQSIAPHMVHPTPFLLPLQHGLRDRLYMGSGLLLYDGLAGRRPALPATVTSPTPRACAPCRRSTPARSPAASATTTPRSTMRGSR
jgi:glycerol-3-phosphate dehydrogenase